MTDLPWDLLTSVPAVVTVAVLAIVLLGVDLLRRELGAPADGSVAAAGWQLRLGARRGSYRLWGLLTTALFAALVATRFVVLGT